MGGVLGWGGVLFCCMLWFFFVGGLGRGLLVVVWLLFGAWGAIWVLFVCAGRV